jgi:hypothetical protein
MASRFEANLPRLAGLGKPGAPTASAGVGVPLAAIRCAQEAVVAGWFGERVKSIQIGRSCWLLGHQRRDAATLQGLCNLLELLTAPQFIQWASRLQRA